MVCTIIIITGGDGIQYIQNVGFIVLKLIYACTYITTRH